jgi:DNA polymerase/3'-5' exonuclease PolX
MRRPRTYGRSGDSVTLREAYALVTPIVAALGDACDEVTVAGSLRRQKQEPHDAEIVVLPKYDNDLFGDVSQSYSRLDADIDLCVGTRLMQWDNSLKRNGPRYKRFRLPCAEFFALDLFIADADNYGNTLAIRTGDADFSRLLVTPIRFGGLMPVTYRQSYGYLLKGEARYACRTEEDFFAALGIPVVDPRERNLKTAEKLVRGVEGEA